MPPRNCPHCQRRMRSGRTLYYCTCGAMFTASGAQFVAPTNWRELLAPAADALYQVTQ